MIKLLKYRTAHIFSAVAILLMLINGMLTAIAQSEPARLRVITKPADAIIIIDGKQRGTSPITMKLKPGKHLLIARKSAHTSHRRTINLKAGQIDTCELQLKPVNGLVLIHTDPPGADMQIDGASRGTTPLFISDLPIGHYRATFTKPGYLPKQVEIRLSKREPVKYDINLTPDTATLEIDSDPHGATVTVNGVNKGQTPCQVEKIPSGEVILEMDLRGYRHYRERLVLAAGNREHIKGILKPIPSNLKIVTIPTGARIYVNNQYSGKSPLKLKNLAAGTYHVRAEMRAYDIKTRDIHVGHAQDLTEEFRLTPNAGAIEITTEPAGVKVMLNGKTVGVTPVGDDKTDRISQPLRVSLIPCGPKTMKLVKPGYFEKEVKITIERDQTFAEHYKLKRRFIPNYEIKTANSVYRGILISVDAQHNVKLETSPGIFKTIRQNEIVSYRPLREDQIKKDMTNEKGKP